MRSLISRRTFLATSAALPVGLSSAIGLGRTRALDGAPEPIVDGGRLKPSLNAFSFQELLEANGKDASKGIDLFGVCDFCAKHGFDAVDATGYFFPGYPGAPPDRYLVKLKRHVFDLGLELSGTGVRRPRRCTSARSTASGTA